MHWQPYSSIAAWLITTCLIVPEVSPNESSADKPTNESHVDQPHKQTKCYGHESKFEQTWRHDCFHLLLNFNDDQAVKNILDFGSHGIKTPWYYPQSMYPARKIGCELRVDLEYAQDGQTTKDDIEKAARDINVWCIATSYNPRIGGVFAHVGDINNLRVTLGKAPIVPRDAIYVKTADETGDSNRG